MDPGASRLQPPASARDILPVRRIAIAKWRNRDIVSQDTGPKVNPQQRCVSRFPILHRHRAIKRRCVPPNVGVLRINRASLIPFYIVTFTGEKVSIVALRDKCRCNSKIDAPRIGRITFLQTGMLRTNCASPIPSTTGDFYFREMHYASRLAMTRCKLNTRLG
jgi:hypothetical protein